MSILMGQAHDSDVSYSETRYALRDKLNIAHTVPILLTVSRLAGWKRVDRAISAMPDVLKSFPNCVLMIVGDGTERDKLQSLAKQLGIEKSVIFTGAVKQKDVWKYYAIADIFLSLYDLSNVGNPLIEAMRYGKAIITLDIGDTYKVIKNEFNGILLPVNKSDRIAATIVYLLSDEKLRKYLGCNAQEYAKQNFWSWNERMNAELAVVNKLRENWFHEAVVDTKVTSIEIS
ncbi:GDP-mannose-dependent alpha-(1-6)-phosphatidylinositol monomannoside mannosyltransferase [Pelotomaculum schinkii]|uniref:GDP-mannose-dependent alpha-(1-6)-phosphatidylinositol monomannoside mannosyltransferase n=2 Tax=Pelotomaculum schinkii TaxID=78350 RepID=A0A4Y7RHD8_9FIRM|nr:GDP-mannose-dependent alpha-(1-6)-phosphatidylinositol monomannoside mannosyltransferase [Pelotomaculum schinkii]